MIITPDNPNKKELIRDSLIKGYHLIENLTLIKEIPEELIDFSSDFLLEPTVYNISKPEFKEPVKLTMNKKDKFQVSMAREATKLSFAEKRENYKKQMKHSSSIKSDMSALTKKTTSSTSSNKFKKV